MDGKFIEVSLESLGSMSNVLSKEQCVAEIVDMIIDSNISDSDVIETIEMKNSKIVINYQRVRGIGYTLMNKQKLINFLHPIITNLYECKASNNAAATEMGWDEVQKLDKSGPQTIEIEACFTDARDMIAFLGFDAWFNETFELTLRTGLTDQSVLTDLSVDVVEGADVITIHIEHNEVPDCGYMVGNRERLYNEVAEKLAAYIPTSNIEYDLLNESDAVKSCPEMESKTDGMVDEEVCIKGPDCEPTDLQITSGSLSMMKEFIDRLISNRDFNAASELMDLYMKYRKTFLGM